MELLAGVGEALLGDGDADLRREPVLEVEDLAATSGRDGRDLAVHAADEQLHLAR